MTFITVALWIGLWIGVLCLCITACTSGNTNPADPTKAVPSITTGLTTSTATASPTKTPLLTLTLTPTSIPIVMPAVTMSPQAAEDALQELLRTNGNCTGKCLAGIRPDEMSMQQAVNQMARWGMLDIGDDDKGITFLHVLYLDPRQKQVNLNLTLTLRKKTETIDSVSFYIPRREDGEYLGADVWLANREAWRAFRFDNLLKAYGTPSFVGFIMQTGDLKGRLIEYGIDVQYKQLNLDIGIGAMTYRDAKDDIFLCLSKDPHNLGVEINPVRPLTEVQQVYPITWQALTGTDLDAFYQIFTDETNPDGCVKTTLKKIMELDPSFR